MMMMPNLYAMAFKKATVSSVTVIPMVSKPSADTPETAHLEMFSF